MTVQTNSAWASVPRILDSCALLACSLWPSALVFRALSKLPGSAPPPRRRGRTYFVPPSRSRARRATHRRQKANASLSHPAPLLSWNVLPPTCPFPGGHPPLPRKWQVAFHLLINITFNVRSSESGLLSAFRSSTLSITQHPILREKVCC